MAYKTKQAIQINLIILVRDFLVPGHVHQQCTFSNIIEYPNCVKQILI